MGLLVDGVWHDQWFDTKQSKGRFVRKESQFRSWITPDGAPGPSGDGGFAAEAGRYHLYVSYASPDPDLPGAEGTGGHDLALGD